MDNTSLWIIGTILSILIAIIGYTVKLLITIIKTTLKEQNTLLKNVHDSVTVLTTNVNNISETIIEHNVRLNKVEKTANDTAIICKLEHNNKLKNN